MKPKLTIAMADFLKEHDVEKCCLDYLAVEGIPFIRLNQAENLVAARVGRKVGPGKVADCIAFVPAMRQWRLAVDASSPVETVLIDPDDPKYRQCGPVGTAIVLEFKRPHRGRISQAQKDFAEVCRSASIPHAFVSSIEALQRIIPPRLRQR